MPKDLSENPTIATLGRRLRLGVIGGGPGSFIGPVHRTAARLDDRYEVLASVLSSDPDRSRAAAHAIGIDPERAYGTLDDLLAGEAAREDGIDVLAVMTPNDRHHAAAARALEANLDVVCDKPITTSMDDARDLVRRVRAGDRVFCTTYNYSGYPLVRHARAMVREGRLGEVRMVQVCYVQPHYARLTPAETGMASSWRFDPAQVGTSMVLGDIGSHAHHLVTFVTGEQIAAVAADLRATVPGRGIDDCAVAMLRLANGASGVFWVTDAAAGAEHGLSIRVFGALGGLEWNQENPNQLVHRPIDGPVATLVRDGPGLGAAAARATRVAFGHPEGYQEAFANLYTDVADVIAARETGAAPDPLALDFPGVEDGARGIAFIDAAVASARGGGGWVGVGGID